MKFDRLVYIFEIRSYLITMTTSDGNFPVSRIMESALLSRFTGHSAAEMSHYRPVYAAVARYVVHTPGSMSPDSCPPGSCLPGMESAHVSASRTRGEEEILPSASGSMPVPESAGPISLRTMATAPGGTVPW
jgi:hypothetical protein